MKSGKGNVNALCMAKTKPSVARNTHATTTYPKYCQRVFIFCIFDQVIRRWHSVLMKAVKHFELYRAKICIQSIMLQISSKQYAPPSECKRGITYTRIKNFINACKRALDEVAGNCLKVGGSVLFDLLSKSNAWMNLWRIYKWVVRVCGVRWCGVCERVWNEDGLCCWGTNRALVSGVSSLAKYILMIMMSKKK